MFQPLAFAGETELGALSCGCGCGCSGGAGGGGGAGGAQDEA